MATMPLIEDLLAEGERSLTLFLESPAIKAVEALLLEKSGKIYVKCQVRGKEVLAKPEEIVRQLWIHRLTAHYRYPISRLQVEYPITFGRDTSKRADIVIMDADRPTVPYVIVEVKREKAKDGKEQLKSYTEPPRESRRLQSMRRWSHRHDEREDKEVFA
jgi:type I restriction enzyme M protein